MDKCNVIVLVAAQEN